MLLYDMVQECAAGERGVDAPGSVILYHAFLILLIKGFSGKFFRFTISVIVEKLLKV